MLLFNNLHFHKTYLFKFATILTYHIQTKKDLTKNDP